MKRFRFVGVRILVFGVVAVAVVGVVLSLLWNALMPGIFGLPTISFWQALGLFLLSQILFGRFGGRRGGFRRHRFVRRWNDLTPEERERFRRACGPDLPRAFGEGEADQHT